MSTENHPSEATLALHAGGDLGPIARWRLQRHLRQCESCQDELLAFQDVRRMVAGLSDMPEVPWARLSAEMQANIRLGLAAGECVRDNAPRESEWRHFGGFRMAMAACSVAVLIAAGVLMERPPGHTQAVRAGVVIDERGRDASIRNVSYSASGSWEATHVDSVTGDVTVTGGNMVSGTW